MRDNLDHEFDKKNKLHLSDLNCTYQYCMNFDDALLPKNDAYVEHNK